MLHRFTCNTLRRKLGYKAEAQSNDFYSMGNDMIRPILKLGNGLEIGDRSLGSGFSNQVTGELLTH